MSACYDVRDGYTSDEATVLSCRVHYPAAQLCASPTDRPPPKRWLIAFVAPWCGHATALQEVTKLLAYPFLDAPWQKGSLFTVYCSENLVRGIKGGSSYFGKERVSVNLS